MSIDSTSGETGEDRQTDRRTGREKEREREREEKGRRKKAKDTTPSERKHISDIDPNWEEEGLLLRHRD